MINIREAFVFVLLNMANTMIRFLPRPAVLILAKGLGYLTYLCSRSRRKIATANLNLVYGESLSSKEKRAINIKSFQNFALVFLDLFWFNSHTDIRIEKYLRHEQSADPIFDGNPTIIVTAHFGNWEVVSIACGKKGVPLTSVALESKSATTEKFLDKLRMSSGSEIVSRNGAIRKIIRALRSGRGTAFLLDHNTLPEEGGKFVPFFGLAVPVSDVVGAIYQRTNAKIVIAWCMPDAKGIYTVRALPPVKLGEGGIPKEELTAYITKSLENIIRDHPQYWLWCYRRWRYYRSEDPTAKYPFYAKSYERHAYYLKLVKNHRNAQTPEEKEKARALLLTEFPPRKRHKKSKRTKNKT